MHFMGWTGLSGNPGSRLIANTLFRGSAWCFSGFTMTRSSDFARHFHRTDLIAGDTDRAKRSTRHWTTKPRASTSIRKLRAKSGQSSLLYDVLKWGFNALHLHYQTSRLAKTYFVCIFALLRHEIARMEVEQTTVYWLKCKTYIKLIFERLFDSTRLQRQLCYRNSLWGTPLNLYYIYSLCKRFGLY